MATDTTISQKISAGFMSIQHNVQPEQNGSIASILVYQAPDEENLIAHYV